MIDALLGLLDRIIDLRRYQSERLKKQYDVVVVPIMSDMTRVHGDYHQMFHEASRQLAENRANLTRVVEELQARRLGYEPVRQKLLATMVIVSRCIQA